jgi:hypothetical protein
MDSRGGLMKRSVFLHLLRMVEFHLRMACHWLEMAGSPPKDLSEAELAKLLEIANRITYLSIDTGRMEKQAAETKKALSGSVH